MMTRHYFHGDELENDLEQYYCAYCDLFVNQEHFSDNAHSAINKKRYDFSVRNWDSEKTDGRFYRSKNAFNLFSNLPKPKKAKTSPFYRWLLKQQDRDDPIGDVSRDAQRDKDFPLETSSLNKIRSHLINKLACEEAIKAFEEAYKEFKLG